jgi:hypothetical protein
VTAQSAEHERGCPRSVATALAARDEAAALDKSAELFSIPPDQRHRIIVARINEKKPSQPHGE